MKDPGNFLGKSDMTKQKMQEVAMQTEELDFNIEDTDILVKIINSTYAND